MKGMIPALGGGNAPRIQVHKTALISAGPEICFSQHVVQRGMSSIALKMQPCREPPPVIRLNRDSTCICEGRERAQYDPTKPTFQRDCVIYGLAGAVRTSIELQKCPICPGRRRRYVGPDPRTEGLFNYNNRILVTHELLDDYTSVYTSSETPFTAYVTVMQRRYNSNQAASSEFMPEAMFRAVWFAYVNLQDFCGDMCCQRCGPSPQDIIWDGVTVGFNQKHLLPSLRPPTISDDGAPIRTNNYIGKQQILQDAKLRRDLRRVVQRGKGKGKRRDTVVSEDDENSEPILDKSDAAVKAEVEWLKLIPDVFLHLSRIDEGLGLLFMEHFGLSAEAVASKVYKNLFLQLAADESTFQMLNKAALDQLRVFNEDPCDITASQLIGCPALL
ncbi:hypothetical protein H0H81_005593, partial [Sphagnurus paluster]